MQKELKGSCIKLYGPLSKPHNEYKRILEECGARVASKTTSPKSVDFIVVADKFWKDYFKIYYNSMRTRLIQAPLLKESELMRLINNEKVNCEA